MTQSHSAGTRPMATRAWPVLTALVRPACTTHLASADAAHVAQLGRPTQRARDAHGGGAARWPNSGTPLMHGRRPRKRGGTPAWGRRRGTTAMGERQGGTATDPGVDGFRPW
jgi:hypothetical protein